MANVLVGLSAETAGRVALLMPNQLEFIESDLAIAKAGKVRVAINPRLAEREKEFILENSEAEILICHHDDGDFAVSARQRLHSLQHIILVGGDLTGCSGYEEIMLSGSTSKPDVRVEPNSPSLIFYTSGTTGRPKGAIWSNSSRIGAITNMLLDELTVKSDSTMLHLASLSHGSGSKILPFFLRGACNAILPRFEPERLYQQGLKFQATHTFMVPTMIKMALPFLHPQKHGSKWSMESITYGGAPMPAEVLEQALDQLGSVFVQVYGCSEAPHPIMVLSREEHVPRFPGDTRLQSVGREATNIEIRLVAKDGKNQAAGEVWVAGSNVMDGYWQNSSATDEVFSGRFYKTGDVARRDEDGYIYIIGRVRDIIISGGFNVYPAEVEAVLRQHHAVKDVCVLGVADDHWGEKVIAVVVLQQYTSPISDELTAFCKSLLAGYKIPKAIYFREQLPLGSTGKVLKSELRDEYSMLR